MTVSVVLKERNNGFLFLKYKTLTISVATTVSNGVRLHIANHFTHV